MISSEPWGEVDGQAVELFTLSGRGGMTARIATFGGTVHSLLVPDREGALRNVALGFPSLEDYVANQRSPGASGCTYFGALVGRYANRIAERSFVLDGERFELAGNNGPDGSVSMHGGPGGYSAQVWEAVVDGAALRLRHVDLAGCNGFPGTVTCEVTYAVTSDNSLRIDYAASADAPTVVNLTNHTYFNLAGEGSGDVYGQWLALRSDVVQPVDSSQIPVGFAPVAGTPFDFRAMKPIGRDIRAAGLGTRLGEQLGIARGYDHNWVLAGAGYRLAAVAFDPGSGIVLWTYTDQPGVQFYTSNFLAGELVGTSGRTYRQGDGFALETQHFADTPHHIGDSRWPSVVLRPGVAMRTLTTLRFTVAGEGLPEPVRF